VIIRPSKMPPRRLESLRGVVMVDMVNGKIRIRKWPRPRGKPKDPTVQANNELFAQGNKAWKYLSAVQQDTFRNAVEGSPLLPRDLQTAMTFDRLFLFEIEDGRVLYPVKLKREVSEALDTITQTVGQILQRTENGWEGISFSNAVLWNHVADYSITGGSAQLDFPWPTDAAYVRCIFNAIALSASNQRRLRVSQDGGATYIATSGFYQQMTNNASFTGQTHLNVHQDTVNNARTSVIEFEQWQSDKPFTQINYLSNTYGYVTSLTGPVTNLRLFPSAGTLTSGTVQVYAR